mgnify:CR=1 FL=1|tara:strand:- start:160 stop:678 length:519 start_codon:yes stop_codon:yes gene_type:complete
METKNLSRSQLEQLWKDSWAETIPSGRPTPSKMDTYYPITRFNVGVDNDKPIAYRGYGEKDGYTFIGMAYTKPEYLRRGIYSKLAPSMSGKVIVGLSQRNTEFSQSDWVSYWEGKGFTINPTDEELDEIFGTDRDKSITDPFVKFYRNHDRNTWAVKGDTISKWQEILKVEE